MEIGSFIELDLKNSGEYYSGVNTIRLNSARAGIYHACLLYNVHKIYVPYYQCETVSVFLRSHNVEILYYNIDSDFRPLLTSNDTDTAFLFVNYFGVMSSEYIKSIVRKYRNVIVDNCQAFYSTPTPNCYSVYSPRKFFGVPDGCYVVGEMLETNLLNYPQDVSSDSAAFLLKRIEKGCSAVYAERMKNEYRIDNSDILQMSVLTRALLCSVDYESVAKRRMSNFHFAHNLYKSINLINPFKYIDFDNVPMVYPLVIENCDLVRKLADNSVYTGRWWGHVLKVVDEDSFEALLSKFMIPLPIDQRYSEKEIQSVYNLIEGLINESTSL